MTEEARQFLLHLLDEYYYALAAADVKTIKMLCKVPAEYLTYEIRYLADLKKFSCSCPEYPGFEAISVSADKAYQQAVLIVKEKMKDESNRSGV